MDADEMTVDDIIDALEELDDDELVELQNAVAQEIAARNDDSLDLEDDEDEDDDEDFDG